jgi:hypothetical protein
MIPEMRFSNNKRSSGNGRIYKIHRTRGRKSLVAEVVVGGAGEMKVE